MDIPSPIPGQTLPTLSGSAVMDLMNSPERFLNRELSWLAFDQRVLEEAKNPANPLLERVRFLSIAARNLDEFYMVRVASLKAKIRQGSEERTADGLTPQQQIQAIHAHAALFVEDMQRTWRSLRTALGENGIQVATYSALPEADKKWVENYAAQNVIPVLTPIALEITQHFPFIPNKGLSLIVMLHDTLQHQDRTILIQIPASLSRFVRLPGTRPRFIAMEKIIMRSLHLMFSSTLLVKSYAVFRVIRDSEVAIDEDGTDLVHHFETALKRRHMGEVINLGVYHTIDPEPLEFLREQLGVKPHQIRHVNGLLGLGDIKEIILPDRPDLLFPSFTPRYPERLHDFNGDCFAAIRYKDILVHHPYESFDVVVQFLHQAAQDPDVVAIKQTLYRTTEDSPIVEALITAAQSGKSVTALVELKARFDEETNIRLARRMEQAGIQVVYGFVRLKTHAKMSLVIRRESDSLRSYAHFGTGNYHPGTAKQYSDLSLFTASPELCQEAGLIFNTVTGNTPPDAIRRLIVAPFHMRQRLGALIDQEIANAQEGKPAQIWAKCNALLDPDMIDHLYRASQAGVQIDLIVRGSCMLRPGIPGLSENIRVRSLVGRFLEHARIYAFANGHFMPSREAMVYIGSADIMPRNLNKRIEVLVPIENPTVHQQVLDQILLGNLRDTAQSWVMDSYGQYTRLSPGAESFSAHSYFLNNPSLSGRGQALQRGIAPGSLTTPPPSPTKNEDHK